MIITESNGIIIENHLASSMRQYIDITPSSAASTSIGESIGYLAKLIFFGESPIIMIVLATIIITMAWRNCHATRSGKVLMRHGGRFFAIWSAIAGVFHMIDLLFARFLGRIVLIRPDITEDILPNILFAFAFGGLVALTLFMTAFEICKYHIGKIEKRTFTTRLRTLGR